MALRSAVIWLLIVLAVLVIGPPYLLLSLFDRGGVRLYFVQPLFMNLCRFFIGMKLRVAGRENIPREGSFIVMPNHRSYWDIAAVLLGIRPSQVRFVAKKQLGNLPIFGWAMRRAGHIMIDRDNRESAVRTLKEVARRFSGAFSIVIFPEGTRSPGRWLQRFKRGGFRLAQDLDLPILPASISHSQEIMDRHSMNLRPGTVAIRFHPPVRPGDYPDVDALAAAVEARVREGLEDGEPGPAEDAGPGQVPVSR